MTKEVKKAERVLHTKPLITSQPKLSTCYISRGVNNTNEYKKIMKIEETYLHTKNIYYLV